MRKTKEQEKGKAWLNREMRSYRSRVVGLTLLSVLATVFSLAFAYLVRYLINSASAKNERMLLIFSAVLLCVLLLKILVNVLSGYFAERLRAKITCELREKTFSKILQSDYAEMQKYHSGELLTRLTSDVQEVANDTVGLMPAVVGMIVQCFGAIAALLTIDWFFTMIYVICGCIFGCIMASFRKHVKQRQKETLEADGTVRAFMQESVGATITLKAYGAETKTREKAAKLGQIYFQKRMKRNLLRTMMGGVFSLLSNFGLIFAVIWCSVSVMSGNDDYGSILSVILLLMQLQHPFTAFSSVLPVFYTRLASCERLNEIDEIAVDEICERKEESEYAKLKEIAFSGISFDYGREQVLINANARIQKGEIVCLTGASGSGKSTLFKLLLKVYRPLSGKTVLCGDFENGEMPLTPQDRALFAYVPQGKFLFSGTIYENLTFFTNETEKDLETRLKQAIETACAQFVWDLPQGLQTPLNEGGAGLSEGQMQRLAVARAILSNRPILLLDEATSALDGETEIRLLENIRALKDKTCFIVTHRPAALSIADRVLHLEKGEIKQTVVEK